MTTTMTRNDVMSLLYRMWGFSGIAYAPRGGLKKVFMNGVCVGTGLTWNEVFVAATLNRKRLEKAIGMTLDARKDAYIRTFANPEDADPQWKTCSQDEILSVCPGAEVLRPVSSRRKIRR